MAKDETKENLLQTLTNDRIGVPARRDEREAEPREPLEPSRETETGRRPEQVVEKGETRPAPAKKADAPKKYKVRVDDGSGEPVVQELTVEQLAERGVLDRLITTSNQFPTVQKKYQELLERSAGKEPAKVETKPTKPAPPTPAQIRNVYAAMLKATIEGGYMEPDFAEAYPDLAHNLVYFRDVIEDLSERFGHVVEWIKGEVGSRNALRAKKLLDDAIEVTAAKGDGEKGDPLFKDLRKPEVREAFEKWLLTEVDPKVGSLTPENMERFWFAYNAEGILDFTKQAAKKADEPPPKRRAAGDGSSVRQGGPTSPAREKSLLDRMSDMRLGPEA